MYQIIDSIDAIKLSIENKNNIIEQVNEIKNGIKKKKSSIVINGLKVIKDILIGALGNLVAEGILSMIGKLGI